MSSVSTSTARRVVAFGLVFGLLTTGCSGSSDADNSDQTSTDLVAAYPVVIDEQAGTILLPLDRFGLTYEEERLLQFARDRAVEMCMAARGFEFNAVDRRSEDAPRDLRYGLWGVDYAATSGYRGAPQTSGAEAQEMENARPRSDAELDALAECFDATADLTVGEPLGSDVVAFGGYESFLNSPAASDVVEEWRECLLAEGIEMPTAYDEMWIPAGIAPELTEDHLRRAVQDATCKERTGLVRRLAEIEANVQRAFIAENEIELVAQREHLDDAVRAASESLASPG